MPCRGGLEDALTVGAFPLVLAAGVLLIPVVADFTAHSLAADAVGSGTRWAAGHLAAAAGFGIGAAALAVLASWPDRASAGTTARIMRSLGALGAGLMAAGLGADGLGPAVMARAGMSPARFFESSGAWITATFAAGIVLFGTAGIVLVAGVVRRGLVRGTTGSVTVVASALILVASPIPSGWALWVVAAAALVCYLPLGWALCHRQASRR